MTTRVQPLLPPVAGIAVGIAVALVAALVAAPLLAGLLASIVVPQAVFRAFGTYRESAQLVVHLIVVWLPLAAFAFALGIVVSRVLRCWTWPLALAMATAWSAPQVFRALAAALDWEVSWGGLSAPQFFVRVGGFVVVTGAAIILAVRLGAGAGARVGSIGQEE